MSAVRRSIVRLARQSASGGSRAGAGGAASNSGNTIKPVEDDWTEVTHESGQTYWWNQKTNQTTQLGAPKPQSGPPPPASAAPPPPPAAAGVQPRGGLMGVIQEGLAHGVGFSMAQRMMDGIMGPRQVDVVHKHEDGAPPPGEAPSDSGGGFSDTGSGGGSFFDSNGNQQQDDGGGGWGDFFGGGDGDDEW